MPPSFLRARSLEIHIRHQRRTEFCVTIGGGGAAGYCRPLVPALPGIVHHTVDGIANKGFCLVCSLPADDKRH